MKSRITQILIMLYLILTFKMYVDEQWILLCALILFGYIWLIRNMGSDKSGPPVVKLIYRVLVFTLVLTAIMAVVENVWWIIPAIAFMIYTNLDNVR